MPWPSETNHDTAIFDLLEAERTRQATGLQLIASENFASPDVMAATGSVLTNKYSEGYPSKRYYGGNAVVDDIEALAIERVKKLFGADHANVLSMGGRVVSHQQAEQIVDKFLSTEFEGERHERRVAQISQIEESESNLNRESK